MNELAWTATRADTIDRFHGQTPRPEDEAPIIDVFELHPQLVLRAIDETAKAYADGKIVWCWSVLRSRLERGTSALREATADVSTERKKRIDNARTWVDNAGVHYDLHRHVEAELFGDDHGRGILHAYDTPQLRAELLDYWRAQRPRGEQAEADHQTWAEACKRDRQVIAEWKRRKAAELAAQAEAKGTECTPPSESPSTEPDPTTSESETNSPSQDKPPSSRSPASSSTSPHSEATQSSPSEKPPSTSTPTTSPSTTPDNADQDIDFTPTHA